MLYPFFFHLLGNILSVLIYSLFLIDTLIDCTGKMLYIYILLNKRKKSEDFFLYIYEKKNSFDFLHKLNRCKTKKVINNI